MTALSAISKHTAEQTGNMFKLLKEMVLVQSSSYNKAGVDRVAALIAAALKSDSLVYETVPQEAFGNHLVIRTKAAAGSDKQVLLVGHMDTVFPEDTDFNWYKEDSTRSYGPGVADMKGGLVAGIFALKALDARGLLETLPLTFLFNSDEEIGSKTSHAIIQQEARKSAFAFVLECGGLDGNVVTGRKGNIVVQLDIKGQAGHAAYAASSKGSAVLELARKTIAFEALNNPDREMTVNVGLVGGGIGSNTVAENASATIDFRFTSGKDYRFLKNKIDELGTHCSVPNTVSAYEIISTRPPMPSCSENEKLFDSISDTAAKIGLKVAVEHRPGVSDANLIAAEKVPVVDGLGPAGAKDHSPDEYIIKATLPQRALLIAGSILDCREKFQA